MANRSSCGFFYLIIDYHMFSKTNDDG